MAQTKTITLFGKKIEVQVEKEKEEELVAAPLFMSNKTLTASDCSKVLGRLLIPNSGQLLNSLPASERAFLTKPDSDNSNRVIGVTGFDSRGAKFELGLSYWPSLNSLVINKGWNKVVRANSLVRFDVVHVWCYRYNGGLYVLFNFYKAQN